MPRGRVPGKPSIDDPKRPDCPKCGSFMKSNGKDHWKCTSCKAALRKNRKTIDIEPRDDFFIKWGFDTNRAEEHARKCEKGKRLIVTSAQNNTPVDQKFWKSLKRCAEFYGCEIAVIPLHYKNTDIILPPDEEYVKEWKPSLSPYLVKGDITFNNVTIKPDVKISPSTLWPLQGKQAHGGDNWIIFGHPQHHMTSVPTPGDWMPKRLYTTGALTTKNYKISDQGEKASFHHIQGALILERSGDKTFIRQLNADERGHFYDLENKFMPHNVTKGHRALTLTTGDEHVKFNAVKRETYTGKGSITNTLKPHYIVRHDVLDCYALSHHHEKDPMVQFKKFHSGDDDIRAELDEVVDFINETTPKDSTTLIVPSNHHDHLLQALNRLDANKDHKNALFISEMQNLMRRKALEGENYDPLYLYLKDRLTCYHEFLDRNEPYMIMGVDYSQHGDVGVNGSRGSARALANTTHKLTIGHSHGAAICRGVYQTGTSTNKLEYERGLSSHSNTHVIQYLNGKRTIIDIIDRKWRG